MSRTTLVAVSIGIIALIACVALKPGFKNSVASLDIAQSSATTSPQQSISDASASEPTIIAVGDIMLGRNVEALMKTEDSSYPFDHIQDFLDSADTVVANLEGPVLTDHTETPSMSMHFNFAPSIPSILYDHNVKIVNLANNHTYDSGGDGFMQTKKYLDKAGVVHAGNPYVIGLDTLATTTIKNKKFIFIGFNITNPNFNFVTANAYVKNIKKNPDEFLIAMVHGGEEYELHSNTRQETFYRSLIDDGADLVIAHHPHVVEEVEQYKNKLIFYSLGNFIFDQYFSSDVQEELTVKITFKKDATLYELIPVKSIRSQPELMNTIEKQNFLDRLSLRSSSSIKKSISKGIIELPAQDN